MLFYKVAIKRRGRVVSTHTSYSGGPWFKSRGRRPAILTEVFRGITQSPKVNTLTEP
jgi:hypothetical protein